MRIARWILPMVFLFGLISCVSGEPDYITKNVEDKFTIDIPDYMDVLDLENPDAIFQYGNELKEHYVIVITETHNELAAYGMEMGLQEYADLSLEYLEYGTDDLSYELVGDGIEKINGMEALTYKIYGTIEDFDLEIFYYSRYYRSEDAFYYVTTWTLANYERDFVPSMKKIVNSLKEI